MLYIVFPKPRHSKTIGPRILIFFEISITVNFLTLSNWTSRIKFRISVPIITIYLVIDRSDRIIDHN